jgi:hypothetical protein
MVALFKKAEQSSRDLATLQAHYEQAAVSEAASRPVLEAARDAAILNPEEHELAALKVRVSLDRETDLRRMAADLEPQIAAARQRENAARDQADLADFERRKKKASAVRRARYERLAAEGAALAQEMEAEGREAEALRHRGLNAQPCISYSVLRGLHLPSWEDRQAPIYCPAGADRYALTQAFLGRRV